MKRQLLIASDDHRLGEYRGGIYNPGAVNLQDGIFLLARNERFTEIERKHNSRLAVGSCRPMGLHVDGQGMIRRCDPFLLDESLRSQRAEDFRLYTDVNGVQASFSRVLPTATIEQQTSPVNISESRLGPSERPEVDFLLQRIEKNWCFFNLGGDHLLLYSFQPFRLLRQTCVRPSQFQTIHFGCLTTGQNQFDSRPIDRISFSTVPVEFDSEHLLFFVHWRDEARIYRHYGVLIAKSSLQPVKMARRALFAGGDAQGHHHHVVYLMSVVRMDEDFWFFLGEGDQHISFARLSESQVRNYMCDSVAIGCRPHLDEWLSGAYWYEHLGRFRREIVLNRDGTILNGGPHDSHWRLESVADHLELCLVGNARVSCRLRQGNQAWAGQWRWGSRPWVRLTRLGPES